MKKIVYITLVILAFSTYRAQAQMQFESGSFGEVLKKAKALNKKIFIDCYTSWCGPCKMLAADIFPQPKVGDFMNNEFVNFKTDMEKGEGIELRKQFQVNAFPTLLILDSDGNEINRLVGAESTPDAFIAAVKKASKVDNSLSELKKRSDLDISETDNYLRAICSRGIPEESEQALTEAFLRRTPQQRYNNASFKIYMGAIKAIDNNVAVLILEDHKNAIENLGEELYFSFINQKVNDKIVSLYMGDMKKGVNLDECTNFDEFAQPYSHITNTFIFKYFSSTYKLICNSEIEQFLKTSFDFLKEANVNEANSIRRFTYRISITSNKRESLVNQCEIYKSKLTDPAAIAEIDEYMKGFTRVPIRK